MLHWSYEWLLAYSIVQRRTSTITHTLLLHLESVTASRYSHAHRYQQYIDLTEAVIPYIPLFWSTASHDCVTVHLPLASVQCTLAWLDEVTVRTDCTGACRSCWGNTHVTSQKWVWSTWVKSEVTNSWTLLQCWMVLPWMPLVCHQTQIDWDWVLMI